MRPFALTPVHDRLLRGSIDLPIGLYQLHLATAEQLTRLHYSPKSIKWVKKHLKLLADNGYIQADAIPTKFFRSPYYYTLGTRGIHYLETAGLDIPASLRAGKESDKQYLFIEHTLELNDLLISAALLTRAGAGVRLHSFIHERQLKRRPYKTRDFTIVPDAFLRFQYASGAQPAFLLEHDRGSEQQQHFRRRIRAYVSLLTEEPVPVLFTTFVGSQRLEQMRAWTLAELQAAHALPAAQWFRFASFTPPLDPVQVWLKPHWYVLGNDQQRIALRTE